MLIPMFSLEHVFTLGTKVPSTILMAVTLHHAFKYHHNGSNSPDWLTSRVYLRADQYLVKCTPKGIILGYSYGVAQRLHNGTDSMQAYKQDICPHFAQCRVVSTNCFWDIAPRTASRIGIAGCNNAPDTIRVCRTDSQG